MSKITGSGVVLHTIFQKKPCVLLLLDYHKYWGEPGGRYQSKYSIERSAKNEVYEETSLTVDIRRKKLNKYLNIPGKRAKTIYRTFFSQIKPITLNKFYKNRKLLVKHKADPKYLETSKITYVEINKLGKSTVKDVFGKTIKLSPRFRYIMKNEGLKYLQCYYTGFYSRYGLIQFK